MEDYIYQIRNYLPIKFADDEANNFLKYLEETYLENIDNKKYQFAFKAFHMLYMTFIYKVNWFIKKTNNESFEEIKYKLIISSDGQELTKNENISIKQLFDYSLLSESKVIYELLKRTGFHAGTDFPKCQHHVNARNYCSHASGKIEYDKRGIDFLISDELKYVARLQNKTKLELKLFIEKFLSDNWGKSFIGGDIENVFIENNLSREDLKLIADINLTLFKKKSNTEKVIFQKILYLVFINKSQKYLELEKNLFLERLPMLMIDWKDEIKIQKDEKEEEVITKQEIIEEHLIPIINKLEPIDIKKAEKILNL